jgi:hypothetical protein
VAPAAKPAPGQPAPGQPETADAPKESSKMWILAVVSPLVLAGICAYVLFSPKEKAAISEPPKPVPINVVNPPPSTNQVGALPIAPNPVPPGPGSPANTTGGPVLSEGPNGMIITSASGKFIINMDSGGGYRANGKKIMANGSLKDDEDKIYLITPAERKEISACLDLLEKELARRRGQSGGGN